MTNSIASRAGVVHADQGQGQGLTLVPILGPSHDQPPYELLRGGTIDRVRISEVSDAGSVSELRVVNDLDVRVFLIDGQELVGAKQNRILNTDVLVPAKATVTIPVSCVEQGRWRHVSGTFSGGKSASHRVRSFKLARVHQSLRTDQRHDADQGEVWENVAASISSSGSKSATMALSDAYAQRDKQLAAYRSQLRLPEGAVGLAAFHGGRFQGLDLFDRHDTLRYFWESLVDSYALDLLHEPVDPRAALVSEQAQAVREVLDVAAAGQWEAFTPPGEGQDWRLDASGHSGSALVWEDQVVLHLQLFPKQPEGERSGRRRSYRPRINRPWGRRE